MPTKTYRLAERCEANTKEGKRCTAKKVILGLCLKHFEQEQRKGKYEPTQLKLEVK